MTRPRDPSPLIDLPRLLTPAETAAALKVDMKHVLREAHLKNIRRTCTPGGTSRFYAEDVEAVARGEEL